MKKSISLLKTIAYCYAVGFLCGFASVIFIIVMAINGSPYEMTLGQHFLVIMIGFLVALPFGLWKWHRGGGSR
jgi:hypothetical protein